jgi:hypothetical protein
MRTPENNDQNTPPKKQRLNLVSNKQSSPTENIVLLTMCLVAIKRLTDLVQNPYEYLKSRINGLVGKCDLVLGVAGLDGADAPDMNPEILEFIQMRTVVHLVLLVCMGANDAGRGDLSPTEYENHLRTVSLFLCASEEKFNEFLDRNVESKAVLARLIGAIEITPTSPDDFYVNNN